MRWGDASYLAVGEGGALGCPHGNPGSHEGAGLPVASRGKAALPCCSHMSPLLHLPGCQTRMGVSQDPRETGFVRASELKPCTAWQGARDLAEIIGPLSR